MEKRVCVCVCACVRACMRVCVCVCVCVLICDEQQVYNHGFSTDIFVSFSIMLGIKPISFTKNTVEFRYQALGLYMLTSVIWWAYTRDGLIHGWAYHSLKIMAVTKF